MSSHVDLSEADFVSDGKGETESGPHKVTPNPRQSVESHSDPSAVPKLQKSWTPQMYALRVNSFSRLSAESTFYPGDHYRDLGSYLASVYRSQSCEARSALSFPDTESSGHVTMYCMQKRGRERMRSFATIPHFDAFGDSGDEDGGNCVFFLRGYSSPLWLCHIGAKYDIDPEFFRRHLDFSSLIGEIGHYALAPLPSFEDVIQLRITTIGTWDSSKTGASVDIVRQECKEGMTKYLLNLTQGRNMKLADSIVRRFRIHDRRSFSFEQTISIYVRRQDENWRVSVFLWHDIGNDLSDSENGPWKKLQTQHSSVTRIIPIFQHLKRIALKSLPHVHSNQKSTASGKLPQNYSRFCQFFGSTLRMEAMEHDPFYALTEIFRFAAASEHQFLNFMQEQIKAATVTGHKLYGRVSDLQSAKDIIDEHSHSLAENLDMIMARGSRSWPRVPKQNVSLQQTAEEAAAKLTTDYQYLLQQARTLSDRCKDAMTVMMSDAQYRESQKAIQQTEALAKLTLLAFFYVPLSFTTSFFGMNFSELGQDRLSIWVWFVVSIPILLGSFIVWHFNVPKAVKEACIKLHRCLCFWSDKPREATNLDPGKA